IRTRVLSQRLHGCPAGGVAGCICILRTRHIRRPAPRDDSCTKVRLTRIITPMRLLPNDKDIGWVPYIWLVYLVALPINAHFLPTTPLQWAAIVLSMAVFLVLYFRAHWVD